MRVRGSGPRGPSGRWARGATVLGTMLVLAGASAGSALADTTIGATGGSISCSGAPGIFADSLYQVPAGGGAINSFSFQSTFASAGHMIDFLVLRPTGGTTYLVVGKSGPKTLAGAGLNTFPVSPIATNAGDIIGIFISSNLPDCARSAPGDSIPSRSGGDPAVNSSVDLFSGT